MQIYEQYLNKQTLFIHNVAFYDKLIELISKMTVFSFLIHYLLVFLANFSSSNSESIHYIFHNFFHYSSTYFLRTQFSN